MKKFLFLLPAFLILTLFVSCKDANKGTKVEIFLSKTWPKEKAAAWMAEQPWLVGCDYIPANAINQLEMW